MFVRMFIFIYAAHVTCRHYNCEYECYIGNNIIIGASDVYIRREWGLYNYIYPVPPPFI